MMKSGGGSIDVYLSVTLLLAAARVLVTTSPTVSSVRFSEPTRRLQYLEDLTAAIESRIPGVGVASASARPQAGQGAGLDRNAARR